MSSVIVRVSLLRSGGPDGATTIARKSTNLNAHLLSVGLSKYLSMIMSNFGLVPEIS